MDDIQRKLALIDAQLAGRRNLHKQIISTAPLLFAAAGLIAGVVIQNRLCLSIRLWLISLTVCAIITGALYFTPRILHLTKGKNLPYVLAYLTLACFVCLGAVRLSTYRHIGAGDIRYLVGEQRTLATIRGMIITDPHINDNSQWRFGSFVPGDPTSSFYLKIDEAETAAGWAKAAGVVRVRVDESVLDLKAGDYIQAYGWLDRFTEPSNPGQFDTAGYLARKNIFIAASVKSRDAIEILRFTQDDKWSGILTKIKRKLREKASQALLDSSSPQSRSRGLLEALLLGYRGNIDSDTYGAFRKTGLLHFISLSGMHLGILMGMVWWLCKTAGLLKRGRAAVCMVGLCIFLMVVPPRAPTVRAAIICFVFCLSFFFRRRANPLNTLSLAAVIILLLRPTNLFEAGWQLSFASVLGILLFTERIDGYLREKTQKWFPDKTPGRAKFVVRSLREFFRPARKLFSVGLAAWLGGAGILLYHFYAVNPFTSISTVVVFPLVAMVLMTGFLKIIISLLLPTLATLLGAIAAGLAAVLIWVVKFIADLGLSGILIGNVHGAVIIVYYCFIIFAAFAYFQRPIVKKLICTVMILIMIAFPGITKWQRTHRDNLVITCLDVGHGQAILAQLPPTTNILFDAGSLYNSDIGRRAVAAFLDYNAVSKIDCIIISHSDIDHVNGIPEIVDHCRIGGVYANDAFFGKAAKRGTAKFLQEILNKKHTVIKPISSVSDPGSKAKVKFLWPIKGDRQNENLSDNDQSLVSLIEFAGKKILLCSDIENFAQTELLKTFPDLKADIVVVPHHGSARTLAADFLEQLEPAVLIASCAKSQYEKQQVFTSYPKANSFYTAANGAVFVKIGKDGYIKVDSFIASAR